MQHVDVYGVDHSPWVQAVLLGLFDAEIPHELTLVPPLATFTKSGVMMPAARIDNGAWQLESADILRTIGFEAVTDEHMQLVRGAWQGVLHRADSAAHFWGGFSLVRGRRLSLVGGLLGNFLRSFVTLYFFLLIRTMAVIRGHSDPERFGDQFLPFEEILAGSGSYLCGEEPNTLDFLLFGIIQCHCSIYVPPVTALQSDPRLHKVRAWIATMQERFKDYGHLYSSLYFAPYSAPPAWASALDRTAFWLGGAFMIAIFPVTISLVAFLAIRNRRS
jgi:glutathione S-transferase